MKKILLFIWELVKIVVIAAVIVIPIRYFVFQPFIVKGQSMEPNFEHGDYLIVDEISYRFREPQRGEVVVFKYPDNPSQRFIKRIIGLPEETIEVKDDEILIYINEIPYILDESYYLPFVQTPGDINITLEENEYFVLGDNRRFSFDSRRFGSLSQDEIIGRVFFRAWPLDGLGIFEAPIY